MKHASEQRMPGASSALANAVSALAGRLAGKKIFMEVCGTHTMSAARMGLGKILPPEVELISGPGCPVCVSPASFIGKALEYARMRDVAIATFGDMMRVPAGGLSLEELRASGSDVRVFYSPLDALAAAEGNGKRKIVFLGAGFETTAPAVAAAIIEAKKKGLGNFLVLCGHKTVPPAMEAIVGDPELKVDGFICPGHVSAVIGLRPYEFITAEYDLPCVVAGFEPLDILQAVWMLIGQTLDGKASVENQYSRAVKKNGNEKALGIIREVFEPADSEWRGLGVIPGSGLKIRPEYREFDAEAVLPVEPSAEKDPDGCICGDVLKGKARPERCALFGKACIPSSPAGACMVSSEGACAAAYRYGGKV